MAAVLRVQNTGFATGANTSNAVLAGVLAGDRLIVLVREENDTTMTVTSSIDGALTNIIESAAAAAQVMVFTLVNASAGSHTITVATQLAGNSTWDFNAAAWGGLLTTGGADQTNSASSGATTSVAHGSITPSASALIVTCAGFGGDNGGETPGADGMTALNIHASAGSGRQYYQYKISHTGAVDGDFTITNSLAYDAVIAAFLESGGGGETITMDKWLPRAEVRRRPHAFMVPSGMTPPDRTD